MNHPIRSAMSRHVIVAISTESLQSAFDKMQRHLIRHLPVVDEAGGIIGMISERDLQRAMISDPLYISDRETRVGFDSDGQVKDFMTGNLQLIHESANLKDAAQKMHEKHISSLLVVDDQNEMVGIITHDDLLTVLIGLLNREPTIMDDFKSLAYKSPIGAIANFLGQAGI